MMQLRILALMFLFAFSPTIHCSQTAKHTHVAQKANVFEDEEVRIPIPAGWRYTSHSPPTSHGFYQVVEGEKPREIKPPGTLLLYKDGYTLRLSYDTSQASGIIGGRIVELFDIPWSTGTTGDAWACENTFTRFQQPATRALLLVNLVVQTNLRELRKACNLPDLHDSSPRVNYAGDGRWFGGYFTTDGSYFSNLDCGEPLCRELVYTLTTSAKTADQLPRTDDPHLAEIVQEAISIVNSIRYKKYAPRISSPFHVDLPPQH